MAHPSARKNRSSQAAQRGPRLARSPGRPKLRSVAALPREHRIAELEWRVTQLGLENRRLRDSFQQVETANARFAKLLDLAPFGLLLLDAKGVILDINHTGIVLLGRERPRLLRRSFAYLVAPKDVPKFMKHLALSAISPRVVSSEFVLEGARGGTLAVQLDTVPAPIERRKPILFHATVIDITERVRSEAALRSSEQNLRALIDASPHPIQFNDPRGRWQLANWAALELFELTGVEYRNKSDSELAAHSQFYSSTLKTRARKDRAAMEAGRTSRVDEIITTPNGGARVLDVIRVPLFNADGQPKGLVVLGYDITEREQSERTLRQNEERLRHILDTALDAIITIDTQGLITHWNPQSETTFGWSQQDAIGKKLVETIIPPQHRQAHERGMRHYLDTGKGALLRKRMEFTALHRDGHEFPVELAITPVVVGEQLYFSAFVRDITERKQAEEALRESRENLARLNEELEKRVQVRTAKLNQINSALQAEIAAHKKAEEARYETEAKLQAILDHSPSMIFLKDAQGRYLHFNREFARVFDLPLDKAIGKTDVEIFPPEQAAAFQANDQAVLISGVPMVFDEVARYDGEFHTSIVTKFPLYDGDGKIRAVGGIVTDITERKRREAEVLQISEREQLRIAQDLHDGLGQQLAGLWCLADVLRKGLESRSMPEAITAANIAKLLDGALAQTRSLSRGLHPVSLESTGLMTALQDMAAYVTDLFKVSCRFECYQPVLIEDNALATHLYRIAQEAVTNSIKHGRAKRIDIGLSSMPRSITLAVSDDGAGFKKSLGRQKKGLGMRIMNYRANMIGGALVVQPGAHGGVDVMCTVKRFHRQTAVKDESQIKTKGKTKSLHR